jgi:hypothetical protein
MGLKFSNNSEGTLATGISAGATSLTLTPGHGARFPEVDFAADGDYFYATLVKQSGSREVIKVKEHKSAVDIDQFSIIERSADTIQTSAANFAFSAADKVQLRLPAVAILSPDATKSTTFQLDSDNTGPNIKNNSGVLEVRNATDAAYANLKAAGLTLTAALAIGGAITGATTITMSGALTGVTSITMAGALTGATTGAFSGAVTVGGTLGVTGAITAATASNIEIDNESDGRKIVARDHGTVTDPEVVNVVYGTGSPPTASNTPIGTLFIKYIA